MSLTCPQSIKTITKGGFLKLIAESRVDLGQQDMEDGHSGILYWMRRDCRVQDNWAMLFAQKLALKWHSALYVCFFADETKWMCPTKRQLKFLADGLKCVKAECDQLNIRFYFVKSSPMELAGIVRHLNIGCVVTDFSPLKKSIELRNEVGKALPTDVPFVMVDAHNIVPVWLASGKQEIAARTIRSKIAKKLPEFMTGYPLVCKHPYVAELAITKNIINNIDVFVDKVKFKIHAQEVTWAKAGPDAGLTMLHDFILKRLKMYGECSNDPSKNVLSNLSPWIHFGQISAQRCAVEVKQFESVYKNQCSKFLDELIVRKELSDNYCYYNENYDTFEGADAWAKATLNTHRDDKRPVLYTRKEFEKAATHDNIWNCAQSQLLQEGKMHGYMRMYWCKKILEWSKSPNEAIETALYLNDTYSLDGNDPNGFVGVMWSICGVHDHGWKERPIFGKIRFMVESGLRKKFDIDAYCTNYGSNNSVASGRGIKRKLTN